MKIHLSQIPPEGLRLEGEEDCPIMDVAEVSCLGPLRYKLELGVSNGALWARGEIAQRVKLVCVACLQTFEYEIRVPGFALHTELPGPEVVDITPFLREDILLNLPAYPRCDRDGERVCKGANASAGKPSSSAAAARRKREHDWSELDKLRLPRKSR